MVRYIDDFVLCFQYRADALRVQEALAKRLRRFSLTLEPAKTKLVEFGRYAHRHAGKRGRKHPETINFLGFYFVLHSQSERELSDWTAYREGTIASYADALSATNAADTALAVAGTGQSTQSNASRPLCILRHRRKHSSLAPGTSGCGALLAQDGEQSELGRRGWMEAVPSNPVPVPADSPEAVSSLLETTGSRHAVNQPPRSVVRQIRTLRSVAAGGGPLPPATRWRSAMVVPTATS